MTTRLKLRRDETETDPSPEGRTLRFPVEAVSSLPAPSRPRQAGRGGAVAGRVRPSIPQRPPSSDDLVRQIERTLDRVQERFDDLKGQIEDGYRISPRGPGDWDRPSAA
jgi:hypothetical protein